MIITVKIGNLLKSMSEGLNLKESLQGYIEVLEPLNVSVFEGINFNESLSRQVGTLLRTLSENVNLNEVQTGQVVGTFLKSISENLNFSESAMGLVGSIIASVSEGLNIAESVRISPDPEYPGFEYYKFGYINNPYWVKDPELDNVHYPCGYYYKKKKGVT